MSHSTGADGMPNRTKIFLALIPLLTAIFATMGYFFLNVDSFRNFICQTFHVACPSGPEKVEFTVEVPEYHDNPYWKVIVSIDNQQVGTIFTNDKKDREITIDDFTAGTHDYALDITIYELQGVAGSQYDSTAGSTEPVRVAEVTGDQALTIHDGDVFRLAYEPDYDSEPTLQKE